MSDLNFYFQKIHERTSNPQEVFYASTKVVLSRSYRNQINKFVLENFDRFFNRKLVTRILKGRRLSVEDRKIKLLQSKNSEPFNSFKIKFCVLIEKRQQQEIHRKAKLIN